MSCSWYRTQLETADEELWFHGQPSSALLDHARGCESCERLLRHELQLRALLTELAAGSRNLEPSASVKRNLLVELDTLRAERIPRGRITLRFAFAIAALVCLVIGLALALRSRPHPTTAVISPATPTPKTTATPPAVVDPSPIVSVPAHASPSRQRREPPRPTVASNDFYPVVMCDSITCAGPSVTVRVELPTSPLVARRNGNHPVMADLLVGEDGLVRGVRLLQ
jgi:hypothetical protein